MKSKPLLQGAAAEERMINAGLSPISYHAGTYTIRGPFFINCAAARIYRGPDLVDLMYSWSQGTNPAWQYFSFQPGTVVTLVSTATAYIGCANPVVSTASQLEQQVPNWVSASAYAITRDQTSTASTLTSPLIEGSIPQPLTSYTAHWYDETVIGQNTTIVPDGSCLLTPFQGDVAFDILDFTYVPAYVKTTTRGWNSFSSTTSGKLSDFNMIYALDWSGYVTYTISNPFAPAPASGFTLGHVLAVWFAVLSADAAFPATDMFTINGNNTFKYGFCVGPVMMSPNNSPNIGNIFASFSLATMPGAYKAFGFLPIAARIVTTPGEASAPPTDTTTAQVFTYTYNQPVLRRRSQTFIGEANRNT